jgi:hypothetical protein
MSYKKQNSSLNDDKNNGIGQKIKCNVTDCMHNCIDDSTCRLECINVGIMNEKSKAKTEDDTCCNSYNFCGDLNEKDITGRN